MAKTKVLISFTVTAKLICVFVFAYAKSRFSDGAAQVSPCTSTITVPDPRGGLRGTCPPEEAKSALKNDKKKNFFFNVLMKEKVGEGAQIEL